MIDFFRSRKLIKLGLALGFISAIQIIFISLLPSELSSNDSMDYDIYYSVMAERIAENGEFVSSFYFNDHVASDKSGEFVTRFPPGHPLIIAATYWTSDQLGVSRDKLIKLTFVLFYALSACLIYKIAGLFFNGWIPYLSTIIWVLYPFNLWITKQPNSEIPFLLFFLWAIYFFLIGTISNSSKYILMASILISAAMLTRAISLLVPVIFVISYILSSNYIHNFKVESTFNKCLKNSLIMVAVPLLIILPWEVVMYQETGKIIPLASSGKASIEIANDKLAAPRPDGTKIVSDDLKHFLTTTPWLCGSRTRL